MGRYEEICAAHECGDEGIAHRLNDSEPKVLVTDAANAPRFREAGVPVLELTPDELAFDDVLLMLGGVRNFLVAHPA
jgi:acyl-coenzyme A synthetase/AMP-(fatty) acid ligase